MKVPQVGPGSVRKSIWRCAHASPMHGSPRGRRPAPFASDFSSSSAHLTVSSRPTARWRYTSPSARSASAGDEVLVPDMTFIASAQCRGDDGRHAGVRRRRPRRLPDRAGHGRAVDHTADPRGHGGHLWGRCGHGADPEMARRHGLLVLEDACQPSGSAPRPSCRHVRNRRRVLVLRRKS